MCRTSCWRCSTIPKARETEPGYTIDTFPKAVQEEFKREYYTKYPQKRPNADSMRPDREEKFVPPPGSDAHLLHHQNFYASVRAGRQSIEDAILGFRAAGPALLTNVSYFERRVCGWDPGAMQRT